MKAAVRDRFGSPDVVELREIDRPVVADDEDPLHPGFGMARGPCIEIDRR